MRKKTSKNKPAEKTRKTKTPRTKRTKDDSLRSEVRFFVDGYYRAQEDRMRVAAQARELLKAGGPEASDWMKEILEDDEVREKKVFKIISKYANSKLAGRWAQSITGVGPVMAAGLIAHIDIAEAPTVGHIWSFAGLDPTKVWEKKTKRPWCAALKRLCWLIGESFVKVSANDKDIYGKVYLERKLYEIHKNESHDYADQAKAALEKKKFGDDTKAKGFYTKGLLPPGHIHSRAKRYAVKLFLAHFHHVLFESTYGYPPPKPYVIEHQGHVHFIGPPNWPMAGEEKVSKKRRRGKGGDASVVAA